MGLQSYYDNFATQPSRWATDDPTTCACHGRGWFLSDLDTWHKCPLHKGTGIDPEDFDPNAPEGEEQAAVVQPLDTLQPLVAAEEDAPF